MTHQQVASVWTCLANPFRVSNQVGQDSKLLATHVTTHVEVLQVGLTLVFVVYAPSILFNFTFRVSARTSVPTSLKIQPPATRRPLSWKELADLLLVQRAFASCEQRPTSLWKSLRQC